MSGRIYLVLMVWSVASFFALGALLSALRRAIPKWSRELRVETARHWESVQTTVQNTAAAVPKALREIPQTASSQLIPREPDFQI